MMTETDKQTIAEKQDICCRAGFLPVPLGSVPLESLNGLELYIANGENYSLYRSIDLNFGTKDMQRLLESKVEFVYVSVHDHQAYYQTIENSIEKIIADPGLQKEKKSEILYATTIELSNQLLAVPPGREEINRTAKMARATVEMILKDKNAFSRLYEAFSHDFYTATHLVNVCGLTISLAQKMGLMDASVLQQIGMGGMLHDIGKIFIPDKILNKLEPLNNEEFETIKAHVDRGREHLGKVMEMSPEIVAIITQHHERMDGSGYPQGLKHDELSAMGRLAGIVDTFDAMTSVRPYREHTHSVEEAMDYLEGAAPEKFDREVVHAFGRLMENSTAIKDEKSGKSRIKLSQSDPNKPKHLQYYFRMPITVKRVGHIKERLVVGSKEKVIAHKISCLNIGLLSPRPFALDQNILISAPQLEAIKLDKLLAVVTQCRDHNDGWYTVTAQFPKPQSAQVIDQIKTIIAVREVSSLAKQ